LPKPQQNPNFGEIHIWQKIWLNSYFGQTLAKLKVGKTLAKPKF